MACLVSCASVMSDDWRLQPKRHDYTWTESPRLWAAIVGDPSILWKNTRDNGLHEAHRQVGCPGAKATSGGDARLQVGFG